MFSNQASFPALARGIHVQDRVILSNILQKTAIEINEKIKFNVRQGADAESLVINNASDTINFNANREFLFLIQDESSGIVVFTGTVTNPE